MNRCFCKGMWFQPDTLLMPHIVVGLLLTHQLLLTSLYQGIALALLPCYSTWSLDNTSTNAPTLLLVPFVKPVPLVIPSLDYLVSSAMHRRLKLHSVGATGHNGSSSLGLHLHCPMHRPVDMPLHRFNRCCRSFFTWSLSTQDCTRWFYDPSV